MKVKILLGITVLLVIIVLVQRVTVASAHQAHRALTSEYHKLAAAHTKLQYSHAALRSTLAKRKEPRPCLRAL